MLRAEFFGFAGCLSVVGYIRILKYCVSVLDRGPALRWDSTHAFSRMHMGKCKAGCSPTEHNCAESSYYVGTLFTGHLQKGFHALYLSRSLGHLRSRRVKQWRGNITVPSPPPATSNLASGFPRPGFPSNFLSKLMAVCIGLTF